MYTMNFALLPGFSKYLAVHCPFSPLDSAFIFLYLNDKLKSLAELTFPIWISNSHRVSEWKAFKENLEDAFNSIMDLIQF